MPANADATSTSTLVPAVTVCAARTPFAVGATATVVVVGTTGAAATTANMYSVVLPCVFVAVTVTYALPAATGLIDTVAPVTEALTTGPSFRDE